MSLQWVIPDALKGEVRRVLGYPDLLSSASIQAGYPGYASTLTMFQPYAILEDKLNFMAGSFAEAIPVFGAEHAYFSTLFVAASFSFTITVPTSPASGATLRLNIAGQTVIVATATTDTAASLATKVVAAINAGAVAGVIPTVVGGSTVVIYANAAGKSGNGVSVVVVSGDPSIQVAPIGPIVTGITSGGMDPPGPYFQDPNMTSPTFGYLPTIRALESDLASSRNFMFFTQAETFIPRADEPQARLALLRRYRRELADRLSVPLDPDITGNRSRFVGRVV